MNFDQSLKILIILVPQTCTHSYAYHANVCMYVYVFFYCRCGTMPHNVILLYLVVVKIKSKGTNDHSKIIAPPPTQTTGKIPFCSGIPTKTPSSLNKWTNVLIIQQSAVEIERELPLNSKTYNANKGSSEYLRTRMYVCAVIKSAKTNASLLNLFQWRHSEPLGVH